MFKSACCAVAMLGVMSAAGMAVADDDVSERAQSQDGAPLLAGPTVEEEAKQEGTVSRMGEHQRGIRSVNPPPRMWIRLVGGLDLTAEQRGKVEEIIAAHRQAIRQFEEEHGEALHALREKMRALRQAEAPDLASIREVRERLQELRAKAPDPAATQQAIWKVLDESQQEAMREAIAQWQERRAERMRMRREGAPMPMRGRGGRRM